MRHGHLLFVPAIDWCSTLKGDPAAASVPYAPGQPYLGSSNGYGDFDKSKAGWLNAIDLETGRSVWRFHAASPMVSGVVSTAGGIVAAGDYDGNFRVYDSAKGKTLYVYDGQMPAWSAQLSDAQIAAVLTYLRSSHGSSASSITAAQVTSIKQ